MCHTPFLPPKKVFHHFPVLCSSVLFVFVFNRCNLYSTMPIGKIGGHSGKGADYSAGNVNLDHSTQQSGGKAISGYQKTDAQHTYGAGALNIEAQTSVPKTKENLGVGKGEGAGTSQYGAGAVSVEQARNAPKIKHEGLGQIDKTKEQVHVAEQ